MTDAQIKELVRARDNYCCTECGMTSAEHLAATGKRLEVHRVVPGSRYAVDDSCRTLCWYCHSTKPRRRPRKSSSDGLGKLVRVVVTVPHSFRAAVREVAMRERTDMGDIVVELIQGNAAIMEAVRRITARREEDRQKVVAQIGQPEHSPPP